MRTTAAAWSVLVVAALALSGCSGASGPTATRSTAPGTKPAAASSPAPDAASAPEGFEKYYSQTVKWVECDKTYQCATIKAPESWHDSSSKEITLALKRQPATGSDRYGALLVNPGGPGGSGVDFVKQAVTLISKSVQQHYDVVGFDPRGVGKSTPVKCLTDKELDAYISTDFPHDNAGITESEEASKVFGDKCEQKTGALLGQIDTQSAARDMDMIRAVLGDKKLNYLGYSYGTQLGQTYAGIFPKKVGRLVLDGAVDPTLTADESTEQQAIGFEKALRSYAADCLKDSDCPLTGDVDSGMRQIKALLDEALESPLPTNDRDRPLTGTLAFSGIAVTLYDNESWPYLTSALSEAMENGTGSILLRFADAYYDRDDKTGTYTTNQTEFFQAINCLDDPQNPDRAAMKDQADRLAKEAPTVGYFFSYGGASCAHWPYPAVAKDFDEHAAGAPPIVVIGTTGDPATPYSGAQHMAEDLDNGVLVTWNGEGHTAYGRSNSCVSDAVDGFFNDGTVPKDGLTC